jgi:HSP20 family protein
MNLIPRNQFSDFDSLFDDFFTGFPMVMGKSDVAKSLAAMRVDIHEDENGYEITAELPGVKKEDISVTLNNDVLTISASKETETEKKKKGKVIRRERSSGTFTRSFTVGDSINQEDIKANFTDGVLTLSIPKMTKAQPESRQIDIG